MPCSRLVGITEIPSWELGISVFPSGLCPELLDDANECQHILVHKIHWQLKLYHCKASLSTYIQQNNQKVGKKQNKFTSKIAFPVGDVTFRLSMCFAKPRISKWDFPHSTSPDGISNWEIWYFRNSDDHRTPHYMFHAFTGCDLRGWGGGAAWKVRMASNDVIEAFCDLTDKPSVIN